LPEMQSLLPNDVTISYEFDQSVFVINAIKSLMTEGGLGQVDVSYLKQVSCHLDGLRRLPVMHLLRWPSSTLDPILLNSESLRSGPTWRFAKRCFQSTVFSALISGRNLDPKSAVKIPSLGLDCFQVENVFGTSHRRWCTIPCRTIAFERPISCGGGSTRLGRI